MNIKDMIVPLILAIATTWAINHYFFGPKDSSQQHEFSAPQSKVECQPLQKDIHFTDAKRSKAAQLIPIETSWGSLEFSTDGGSLTRLSFNRSMDGALRSISTIYPPESDDKQNFPFLIALDENTPFFYRLVRQEDTGSTIDLTFEGSSDTATISKTFVIYKEIRQVDLKLEVDPRSGKTVQVRIFYPAPVMPELKDQQMVAADILFGADTFKKEYRNSIKPENYWVKPTLFGAENKYFVHSLVNDTEGFVQRAYYKLIGTDQLQAILEGPPTDTTQTWNLSFYLGPKEFTAMKPVDERLEYTLEYSGMWAPVSRVLLMILNWLNDYVHNYGFAIIILTALMRLLLLPFSLRAKKGMKDRTESQRKLQYIQQKYKDDPQAKAQAQAEYMRKHGLGLAGCLPLLIQFPVFLGLSKVLSSSIELYQSPFLWIKDLSAPDPYYILPVAVMIGILYRALASKDNAQRLPLLAMALVFGAFSATLPAGLVLYIAIGSVLNVA